ncbi:MAG: aminotransferase class I/II-fold pyridoxal phosphate-dependent enzyme [Candidatus Marinimicrobia bacterium]|nr:aminotransferase class I/II-fold pyridoxal phosphate-dependent enzyme [Candidatus Neomarinimicrobiota bacterium]
MDIFEKCYRFHDAQIAREQGWYPYFVPFTGGDGTVVEYNGKNIIMIGSNNYLGLTNHPRLIEAAENALRKYGTGRTGSRFLNGTIDIHLEFEKELAEFVGKESALIFSTGYLVNLGVISTLLGKNDVVVIDRLDHASIVDGCLLSRAEILRFRHNDIENLKQVIFRIPKDKGVLVVVDGIFSMEGDIAKLPEIVEIVKNRKGARLMVDDAHSLGVLGPKGSGTSSHFGLTEHVDLIMGTFSKSFAAVGGFIAGDEYVIDYIRHHTRSFIFTASLPPSVVASTREALKIIKEDDQRRENLWKISNYMRDSFKSLGFDTSTSETPIIPIVIGDSIKTFLFWKKLFQEGVYTNAVVAPAVPENSARLRTSYIATHTFEQMDYVLSKFEKVGKELGII